MPPAKKTSRAQDNSSSDDDDDRMQVNNSSSDDEESNNAAKAKAKNAAKKPAAAPAATRNATSASASSSSASSSSSSQTPKQKSTLVSEQLEKQVRHIVASHIESFNEFADHYLQTLPDFVQPFYVHHPDFTKGKELEIRLKAVKLEMPHTRYLRRDPKVYPSEARQENGSYTGRLDMTIQLTLRSGVDGKNIEDERTIEKYGGQMPIMVGSNKCHTSKFKTPLEYAQHKEDIYERGGYFIINGNEKIIRLVCANLRNHVCWFLTDLL